MEQAVPSEAMVGHLLGGRYRLVRLVSTDGSVDVFEAEDARLQRSVAVKLQHGDAARRPIPSNNPDLARVLDGGEHRGARYVVMELVDGPTQIVERPAHDTSLMPIALTPTPGPSPVSDTGAPHVRTPWSRRVLLGLVTALMVLVVALGVTADDGDLEVPPPTVPVTAETTTTVAPTTTSDPTPPPPPEERRGKKKGKAKGHDAEGDDG